MGKDAVFFCYLQLRVKSFSMSHTKDAPIYTTRLLRNFCPLYEGRDVNLLEPKEIMLQTFDLRLRKCCLSERRYRKIKVGIMAEPLL